MSGSAHEPDITSDVLTGTTPIHCQATSDPAGVFVKPALGRTVLRGVSRPHLKRWEPSPSKNPGAESPNRIASGAPTGTNATQFPPPSCVAKESAAPAPGATPQWLSARSAHPWRLLAPSCLKWAGLAQACRIASGAPTGTNATRARPVSQGGPVSVERAPSRTRSRLSGSSASAWSRLADKSLASIAVPKTWFPSSARLATRPTCDPAKSTPARECARCARGRCGTASTSYRARAHAKSNSASHRAAWTSDCASIQSTGLTSCTTD